MEVIRQTTAVTLVVQQTSAIILGLRQTTAFMVAINLIDMVVSLQT
jgi:hypothetical protein